MASDTVTLIKANPYRFHGRPKHYRKHRRNPMALEAVGLKFELPGMNDWVGGILGAGLQTVAPQLVGTLTDRFLGTMSARTKSFLNVALSVVALGAVAHFGRKQLGASKNPFIVGAGSIAAFQALHLFSEGKVGISPSQKFFSIPGVATKGLPAPRPVGAIEAPRVPMLGVDVGGVEPELDAMRMPEL